MTVNMHAKSGAEGFDKGLRDHMNRTYSLIGYGLGVSAISAWLIGFTALRSLVISDEGGLTMLGSIGLWAPLLLLIGASFRFFGNSVSSLRALYWAFVGLQGIGLSLVAVTVEPSAIVQALAITCATFASMSLYGYTTSRNLSGMGRFMLMGLIGIIIASIVNIFLGSGGLNFAISVIGVLVFSGLTAYDTQKLKNAYESGMQGDDLEKMRYWSALGLYLNILNLFNFFLSLGRS